jgi:hypothetical protein
MAIDSRIGNKIQKNLRREEAPATRVDPHPYIGVVKNNLDPTRCGRLQVWIPDLGGVETDSQNWRTVSYASPFMGTTNIYNASATNPNITNKFGNTPHTYGFWAVPPDIGVEVICLFIAGDPLRGYWLACVNSSLSRYMLPAIGSSVNLDISAAASDVTTLYNDAPSGTQAPVTEFNQYNTDTFQKSAFYSNPKPIHEPQYRILTTQGLDRDTVRGTITSSSQRESPSNVFGISTPGRPFPDKGADNPEEFLAAVAAGTLSEKDYAYTTRQGGHSLVMDDGNLTGVDQLMRLRTAKGHQIMMHDTENTIYINHADGTSWLEFTSDGSLNIFAAAGINLRTSGSLNLHADDNININAGQNLHMKAGGGFQVDAASMVFKSGGALTASAGGTIGLLATSEFNVQAASVSVNSAGVLVLVGSSIKQNSGGAKEVKNPDAIQVNSLTDVAKDAAGLYQQTAKLSTIATIAPTHEPYARSAAAPFAPPHSDGIQPGSYSGPVDATKQASATGVKNPAGPTDLKKQPPCNCQIGNLTSDQLTAYYAQIGKSESGGNYSAVNTIGYVGKYQFGYQALVTLGYLKSSCKSNAQMNNPNSWVGKNGMDSLSTFLNSPNEQETAICAYTTGNYTAMCRIGAVTSDQSPEDVAGMLAVAHLLGPGGAKNYRNGQSGADQYGTTGDAYFQKGKYAVAVLAPQVATAQQG